MAPLNWGLVMSYPLDDVNDELAEQLFDQIVDYDSSEENDILKMKRLFEVTKSIMQVKALQADVAMEELEEMAKREGVLGARKEKELMSQIEHLKKQLDRRDSGSYSASTDVQKLNEEILDLQQKNAKLLESIQEKDKQIEKLKHTNETHLHMIAESEKYSSSLRVELEQVKEELALIQRQQEKTEADIELSKQQKYEELAAKLKNKNQQIHQLIDENKELEEQNAQLREEISQLKLKLEEAVEHIERLNADCLNLNSALTETRNRNKDLENMEKALRDELSELQTQSRLRTDLDDEIMDLVTKRVEEWKATYVPKEVFELRARIKDLEQQLVMEDPESEQRLINKLSKDLKDKEQEVQLLKSELEQATKDIENNLTLINELKSKLGNVNIPLSGEANSEQDYVLKLEMMLQEKNAALTTATETLSHLEEETRVKDKELSEVVARMRQYEMGVYGLPEAVAEIKECRSQIRVRDKHIEDLIQQVNQAELLIGELLEENEDFREKLGLELKVPEISEMSKEKYQTRWQKEHSLNLKLQAELEKYEDEIINLKQELHKLHKQLLSESKVNTAVKTKIPTSEVNLKHDHKLKELEDLLNNSKEECSKLREDYLRIRSEYEDLKFENNELHLGMEEILQSIREQDEKTDLVIQSPALDRLLQFIETKHVHGNYDLALTLKSEIDHLKGQNDELRSEVKRLRIELNAAQIETLNMREGAKHLSEKLIQTESIEVDKSEQETLDSSDVSATKDESEDDSHKGEEKEEFSSTQRKELEEKEKEPHLFIQQYVHISYREYLKAKETFENEVQLWNEGKAQLEAAKETAEIKANEFENLLQVLETSEDEQKCYIAELARKVALLKTNENSLKRRYISLQEAETSLRKENMRLKDDFMKLESSVIEQVGYFHRENQVLKFKLKNLQQEVEDSVTVSEFEKVNKRYRQLNGKYKALLEQHTTLQEQLQNHKNLERQMKELQFENEKLKRDLENVTANAKLSEQFLNSDGEGDSVTYSQKIILLEMQVMNESQKAKLALLKSEQQSETLQLLEDRNKILENNFEELSKTHVLLQQENQELKEQILQAVTKEIHEANLKRIKELEASELALQQEISNLKDMVEIARGQANTLELTKTSQEKELELLRNQVLDLQASDESNASRGHLLHQILTLQLKESSLTQQLEKSKNEVLKLQAENLRLKQACDKQDETLFDVKKHYSDKVKFLSKVISDLRHKYSDSLTVHKEEKLVETISYLRSENVRLSEQVEQVSEKYCKAQSALTEMENKIRTLEESIHEKEPDYNLSSKYQQLSSLEALRRSELRAATLAELREEEFKHQKAIIARLEKRLEELEKENASLETELIEKEIKLQQCYEITSNQIGELGNADATSDMPKSAHQNDKSKEIELQLLEKKILLTEKQMKELEKSVVERDRIITQLQATSEEKSNIAIAQSTDGNTVMTEVSKRAMELAQATIQCLQTRLAQKEESIACYRNLLDQARIDYSSQLKQNEREIQALQEQLRSRDASSLATVRKKVSEILNKPQLSVELREREERINQLEEMLSQQEGLVVTLTEKVDITIMEKEQLRQELNDKIDEIKEEKEKAEREACEKLKVVVDELNSKLEELKTYKEEAESLRRELLESKQTPSTPGPDAILRSTVEKLKKQLVEKEKQLQALSKALTDLKEEMVENMQRNARLQERPDIDELHVKRIVDQRTIELRTKVTDLESSNKKLKRDLKSCKEDNEFLNNSIKFLQEEVDRKNSMVDRLVSERNDVQRKFDNLKVKYQEQKELAFKSEAKEIERLRHQNAQLEEQLRTLRTEEKKSDRSREQFVRWEEGKKWQHTTEQLRARLKEKQKEIEILQKNNNRLRDQVIRTDKEKSVLENKVKNLSQLIAVAGTTAKDAERLELQKKNAELQKEITSLHMRRNSGADDSMQEMALRNKILMEKIEELEKELVKLKYARDVKKTPHLPNLSDDALEMKQKAEQLEMEVLKLSEENFSLRLQLEQERTNNPQLQEQISILEKEVKILHSEDEPIGHDEKQTDLYSSILNADIENLAPNESKLMIIALRKGIKKLQAEIASLRKTERRSMSDKHKMSPGREPDVTSQQGPKPPSWKDVAEQKIPKVLAENAKLCKELKAALGSNDKLRAHIEVLTFEKNRMAEEIDDLTKKLQRWEANANILRIQKYH